jgi:hypothetical protein
VPYGLSGSLGGVLKGDTLSPSLSHTASGAKDLLIVRSGVVETVLFGKIFGLPARLIGGGTDVLLEGGRAWISFRGSIVDV